MHLQDLPSVLQASSNLRLLRCFSPKPAVIHSKLLSHSTSAMLRVPSSNIQHDKAGRSVIRQIAYAFNVFAGLQ